MFKDPFYSVEYLLFQVKQINFFASWLKIQNFEATSYVKQPKTDIFGFVLIYLKKEEKHLSDFLLQYPFYSVEDFLFQVN